MINRVTVRSLILAAGFFIAGCSHTTTQQMAAYSVATGFLTLCDDGDFAHALDRFARPLKSSPQGATWTKKMTDNRAKFGNPIQRAMISRNDYLHSPPRRTINFVFQTSFVNQPSAQESVSLEMLDGRWQVYDYQFRPFGKPVGTGTPTPTPHPTRARSPGPRPGRLHG